MEEIRGGAKRWTALLCGFLFCVLTPLFAAQNKSSLVQGFEAYRNGDWGSATLFLRKAVSEPGMASEEAWYMLIMSQMYNEDYASVVTDGDRFIDRYPESSLVPYVTYQKGRALHFLGQNDSAVLSLSDFCHQYPGHEMYSSALYWLAECFFDDFSFDTARSLYERIVSDYPNSSKATEAQVRLDVIAQREREQKLLYLLKMTGEEYLSSRENYEKQLREYQTEDMVGLRRELNDANSRIRDLEKAAAENLNAARIAEQQAQAEREARENMERSAAEKEAAQQRAAEDEAARKLAEQKKKMDELNAKAARIEELLLLKAKAQSLQKMLNSKYDTTVEK